MFWLLADIQTYLTLFKGLLTHFSFCQMMKEFRLVMTSVFIWFNPSLVLLYKKKNSPKAFKMVKRWTWNEIFYSLLSSSLELRKSVVSQQPENSVNIFFCLFICLFVSVSYFAVDNIQLREYWKDLEYRLHYLSSKFNRCVCLNLKPISYFFGIYMAWFFI